MRRWVWVALVMLGCGVDGSGSGDPTCPGCAPVACVPVEGGAPCCDTTFDVMAEDCPEGTEFVVQCWWEERRMSELGDGCASRPGRVLVEKSCRNPGGDSGFRRIVGYRTDGTLAVHGDGETFHEVCQASGLVLARLRLDGPASADACYEACYDLDGAPIDGCPARTPMRCTD